MQKISLALQSIADLPALDELLSAPPDDLIERLAKTDGDILILGVGGKMGPTLARMARRARDEAGSKRNVIGVSRFSDAALRARLETWGVKAISADILEQKQLDTLPDAPNVIYMAGMKFGATGNEPHTWAMNAYLPGMVAQRYRDSRIVAFSTGNIYGLTPVARGGSVESDLPAPVGEYAMSCLGRERMFEHFSRTRGTRVTIFRLNYACELRYGVLVDLTRRVWEGKEINLATGYFNVIWQGDANATALRLLEQCASPPFVINVTGAETLSAREVCRQIGEVLGKPVSCVGEESSDALLSNAAQCRRLYGAPAVSVTQMLRWICDWVRRGGESLNKPTHFEVRDGKF